MGALEGLTARLEQLTAEALEIRFGVYGDSAPATLPEAGTAPQEVLESLVRVRRRLDRVEEILAEVLAISGKLSRLSAAIEASASEKWDEALVSDPRINSGGFVAPKEKYAQANLTTLTERRKAVLASDYASKGSEAVDIVRLAHRGLDALRYDHVVMIRATTVMTSLEG